MVGYNYAEGNQHGVVDGASVITWAGDFAVGGTMTLRSRAQGGVGAVSAGQASAGTVSFIAVQPDPAGPIRNFSFGDVLLTSTANDEFTGAMPGKLLRG